MIFNHASVFSLHSPPPPLDASLFLLFSSLKKLRFVLRYGLTAGLTCRFSSFPKFALKCSALGKMSSNSQSPIFYRVICMHFNRLVSIGVRTAQWQDSYALILW